MSINKNKLFKKMFAVSAGVGAFLIGATMTLYEYGPIINNALQIMNQGADGNTGALSADDVMNLTPESVRAAAITLSTLPILLVYPQLQKYFVSGIVVGSVKG